MPDATAEFLRDFPKAIQNKSAAVFAGAGLSQPAGFVNWRGLLREIANEIGLDVDQEHDLISVAQFHVNERRGRGKLNQLLLDEFTASSKHTTNHQLLAELPIDTYWTTNYDTLIERALERAGKKVDVKVTQAGLATTLADRDAVLYKMHGDVTSPEDAILTKDDYESYDDKRRLFTTKLQGDLISKTFLFIGFSFDDPNLEYILSRIRLALGQNQRPHFCFFRRPQRSQYKTDTEFAYAEVKQELRSKDLLRFAIRTVLVDNYGEITTLLQRIQQRYWRQKLLISGSAFDYSPWSIDRALSFVQNLSRRLAAEFEIVTGFGAGVGSAVLNGVLEYLDGSGECHLDGRLTLRPFPLWAADPAELRRRWTEYRDRMASLAGSALFLFGNKKSDSGGISAADGVREEFAIAVRRGLRVVPVGATGYVAQELWERVLSDFEAYFPDSESLKPAFVEIGRTDLPDDALIDRVVELLCRIRDA